MLCIKFVCKLDSKFAAFADQAAGPPCWHPGKRKNWLFWKEKKESPSVCLKPEVYLHFQSTNAAKHQFASHYGIAPFSSIR